MYTISIIIPFFNAGNLLEKLLKNLISQNTNNYFEIILINDGSKDESSQIAKLYSQNYPYIKLFNQSNKGVSVARNNGLKHSTGEYILFIDADDTIDIHLLSFLKNKIDSNNTKFDILTFDYSIDELGGISFDNIDKSIDTLLPLNRIDCLEMAIGINKIPKTKTRMNVIWAKLFRRELLNKNNITFIENLKIGEDMLFTFEALICSKHILYCPICGYYYYQNPNSTVHRMHEDMIETDVLWQTNFLRILNNINETDLYKDWVSFSLAKGVLNILYLQLGHINNKSSFSEKEKRLKLILKSNPYSSLEVQPIIKYFSKKEKIILYLIDREAYLFVILLFNLINIKKKIKNKMGA